MFIYPFKQNRRPAPLPLPLTVVQADWMSELLFLFQPNGR